MDVGTVEAAAVVGALLLSGYQTGRLVADSRHRDQQGRIQLALDLYRDLVVDGDTATAFHRVSVRLRAVGTERFGLVTWYLPHDSDLDAGGLMDPNDYEQDSIFADLYRVMWYFERANLAMKHELVDRDVLFEAAGFHIWWWNQILRNVERPKAIAALRELGVSVTTWAEDCGELAIWKGKCTTDFDGTS